MTEVLAEYFAAYGLPALAVILAAGQFGVPLPTSIILLTAGALQAVGDLSYWPLVAAGVVGAMTGDHAGYLAGRLAAPAVMRRASRTPRLAAGFAKADRFMDRWGTAGVFFTRWLVSPIGPAVNLAAGVSAHPLWRFTLADLAGEIIWVAGYVALGALFADQIALTADILANAGWAIGAIALTAFLGWRLLNKARRANAPGDQVSPRAQP